MILSKQRNRVSLNYHWKTEQEDAAAEKTNAGYAAVQTISSHIKIKTSSWEYDVIIHANRSIRKVLPITF